MLCVFPCSKGARQGGMLILLVGPCGSVDNVQVASALALVHVDASKAGVPDAPLSKEAFVKLAHAALASQRAL